MGDIRFEISANAGELLRAEGQVVRQQAEVEKGFAKMTAASQTASKQTAIAIKNLADQAEAAAKRINAANFSFGGAGGAKFKPYGVEPLGGALQSQMMRIAQYQGDILAMRRRDGMNSFAALPAADPFAARNASDLVARQVREGWRAGGGGRGGKGGGGGDEAGFFGGLNTYLVGQQVTQGVNFIVSAMGKYSDTISVAASANADFEKSLGKLFSLGENFKRMDYWRDQVLAFSGAWGKATPEVVAAIADVQRMMQGASETQQRSMLASTNQLSDLIGGSLSENLKAATKLMQAFGNEAGTAAQINSKLFALYRGGMAPEDVDLIARMSTATKEAGINANETLAVFKTISTLGGSNPLLVQGFRQFVLHLDALREHGMDLGAGDIGQKFQNLAKFVNENPDMVNKVLPARSGAAASIKAIADNVDLLRRNLVELKAVTGGEVGAATITRMGDPAAAGAMVISGLKQELANVQIQRGRDPDTTRQEILGSAAEIGHALLTPAWQLALETPESQKLFRAMAMQGMGGEQTIAGLAKYVTNLRATKTTANSMMADYVELMEGNLFNVKIATRYTHPPGTEPGTRVSEVIYAGPTEAEEYAKLRGRGFNLNLSTYESYKQLQSGGRGAQADSVLHGTRDQGADTMALFHSGIAAFGAIVNQLAAALPSRALTPGTRPASQPTTRPIDDRMRASR